MRSGILRYVSRWRSGRAGILRPPLRRGAVRINEGRPVSNLIQNHERLVADRDRGASRPLIGASGAQPCPALSGGQFCPSAVLTPLLLRSCDRRVLTPQRAQMSFVDKVTARDVRRAAYLEGGLLRGVWYLSLGGAEEKSGILMLRYLNGRN